MAIQIDVLSQSGSEAPPTPASVLHSDGCRRRSGQPVELNYPFLEKLHLKKILYFSPEPPPPNFQNFINDQGIDIQRLGVLPFLRCTRILMTRRNLTMLVIYRCRRGRKAVSTLEPHVRGGGPTGAAANPGRGFPSFLCSTPAPCTTNVQTDMNPCRNPVPCTTFVQTDTNPGQVENNYPICLMDSVGRNR